ncbi:hypothetical protein GQ53DRAFT_413873 [Thozetella sp. PMI_491]|nr:hypothetical protein GQ53DRAFT_413873 [Thozetella sp. PMI_491]
MPYTPPSHRSPASSNSTSPNASRRPSVHGPAPGGAARPVLPRSASYLTRHRRTPSAVELGRTHPSQPTPEATSEDLKGMVSANGGSVRQSPPPVTDVSMMPKGAIISPPESNTSSDDDELPEMRGRNIENLKELHDAISQIPQNRTGSPTKGAPPKAAEVDAGDLLVLPSQAHVISEGMHHSFSTGALDELAVGRRKVSHARSVTEPSLITSKSAGNSLTGSEEDSDEEIQRKPQMVRKKSGELVRPALRPPSRRRPSSMPGTPTFSKAVHFDSHLEHVRHFLQVDRPLAVSAGSSPVDNYDSESEYPFSGDERVAGRGPPFEWELLVTNFPVDTPARKSLPVRLERVWLSNDQKCLIGSVVVTNLAFQKYVTCRFTLDYWKTTSEIAAEYISEVRPRQNPLGQDRFHFTLKLSDLANLESKTLFLCIRYNVGGQEFWDNNNGTNFQIDFRKKMLPQNGKNGPIGAANRPANNALPRSNRRSNPSSAPRPKSMPVAFDEFGDNPKVDFEQSIHDYLGESGTSGLRLKGVKSSGNIPSDNLAGRLSAPSGQAFANRYDFGASLRAVQTVKDSPSIKGDGLYMKANTRRPAAPTAAAPRHLAPPIAVVNRETVPARQSIPALSGTDSPSASISSSSYEELVNKYCFFGSKQSSPQVKDGTLQVGRFDGADDIMFTQSPTSTNSSPDGSPIQLGQRSHAGPAQHHSLYPQELNPYFHPSSAALGQIIGVSPSESPLRGFSPQTGSPLSNPPRSASASSQATVRTSSPANMGSFQPFGGTSPNEFQYQHLQDRFPFSGTETHAAAAIRG